MTVDQDKYVVVFVYIFSITSHFVCYQFVDLIVVTSKTKIEVFLVIQQTNFGRQRRRCPFVRLDLDKICDRTRILSSRFIENSVQFNRLLCSHRGYMAIYVSASLIIGFMISRLGQVRCQPKSNGED